MKASPNSPGLTIEHRDGYLYACLSSQQLDRTMACDYLAEILLECARKRCKRLLLARHPPRLMDEADVFKTMGDVVRMNSGTKIAFLNEHLPISEALPYIAAIGHGDEFKFFTDAEQAKAWLLQR